MLAAVAQPAATRAPRPFRPTTVVQAAAARFGPGDVPARKLPVQPAAALPAAHPGAPVARAAAAGAPPAAMQQQQLGDVVQRLERSWSSGTLGDVRDVQAAAAAASAPAAAAAAAPPASADFDLDGISALLSDLEGLGLELEQAAESSQQIDASDFTVRRRGRRAAAVGW